MLECAEQKQSAQFGTKLLFEISDDFAHDGIRLLVVHRLGLILQREVDGVALLASLKILAFVNVKEDDALEQFLLRGTSNLLDLGKLNTAVNKQRQVAALSLIHI